MMCDGCSPADLRHELAEIGFDDPHAGGLEGAIQLELLADHRLRLHDVPHATRGCDGGHDPSRVVGSVGPVHVAAAPLHARGELVQIAIEVRDDVGANGARAVAQGISSGEGREAGGPVRQQPPRGALHLRAERRIGERLFGAAVERGGRDAHRGSSSV